MKTAKLEPHEWYAMCPNCEEGFFVNHDDYYDDNGDNAMKDYECSICGEMCHLKLPV